jgi:hypothetical protein
VHPGFMDDMNKAVQVHDVFSPTAEELYKLIENEMKCITNLRISILQKARKTTRFAGFLASCFE